MSEKAKIFKSLLPQKPLELELPKAMVAMAACVAYHAKSIEENFPPTGLNSLWTTFIVVLTDLETASRVNYYKLMHKLYLKSSHSVAPTEHGLSQDQILQCINLAAFAANGNDDDSTLSESDLDQRASQDAQRATTAFSGVDGNATLDIPGSSNGDGCQVHAAGLHSAARYSEDLLLLLNALKHLVALARLHGVHDLNNGPSDDKPGNDRDRSGDNGDGSGGNGDGSASDVHDI
ncbi:hypothetical protein C8J55DRAFT_494331 [Lentinula edodes]|uniref:Uncharacterized protein n=1 Tax=Lentinula lateritia TaxID=40482 RepID=A0A9W8ZQ68_9AGAR|nr:hypothetical protein C8J55DRAFT_494331 [Lentinula edodes]